MKLASLILCVAFLSGCAASKKVAIANIQTPPADRLVCDQEARVPDGVLTDAVVAQYIADLAKSGQSCRTQLAWVREWFKRLQVSNPGAKPVR